MFPSPTTDRPARRSLAELMRGAVGTALEFATLGEAHLAGPATTEAAPPILLHREHPHRQALVRPRRPRRDGAVPPRAPVCTAPVSTPPSTAARPTKKAAPTGSPLR